MQLKTHHYYKNDLRRLLNNAELTHYYSVCALEIGFVTGRMFLEFLGLKYDKTKGLVENTRAKEHDIKVIDFNGKWANLNQLTTQEKEILVTFCIRANKGSAHLTWDNREIDGWEYLDEGVKIILRLLLTNLYKVVNKPMP